MPATRWSSSSTIRRSCRRPTGCSTSVPGPASTAGKSSSTARRRELARASELAHRRLPVQRTARGGAARPASGEPAAGMRHCGIEGAAEHNLKDIDVDIPLRRLVCVTGVSGSGKSTLVHDVLYPALLRAKGKPTENPGRHRALAGRRADRRRGHGRSKPHRPHHALQSGELRRRLRRHPRAVRESCRRRASASTRAGTFSFNAGNGRCPACGGNGFEHVEMQFLSDVYLRCPDCDGRRYRAGDSRVQAAARRIRRRKSIADVLDLTVSEALEFFPATAEVCARLAPLAEVGLDYLRLGQPVPTLSGGEAQRLKLAGHLPRPRRSASAGSARRRAEGGASAKPRAAARLAVPVRRADHRPAFRRRRQAAARVPAADRAPATRCWSSSTIST